MQVLLQPLRQAQQAPTSYALEKQAALTELAAQRRAKRRHLALAPLRAARALTGLLVGKLFRKFPKWRLRLSR
ncbi:hypothetical protein [Alloyangia pacifica]|uniref:hypothetical protein n=1 Tax=Alloyangia pacifica TaxID=311180 RepID=UPI001CD4B4D5|nr:hypothetical protein [Alloyangia pacifica]MCA0995616.1 hypothetical protein [Alloyangia pacifica]